ncbi:MAG: Na+:solute symporter [Planctomycetota bacterium]|jgi:Na+/proline symporter
MLHPIDWAILATFLLLSVGVGVAVSRRAGSSSAEFFLSGRSMPWWLLGISMVATTFAADTPLLVTEIVRKGGVAGNWVWWAFLLSGMVTVFVYARLWVRAGVRTDVEFYELRYSGRPAAFLRGFRSIYLGVIFNSIGMGIVTLALTKICAVMFGIPPWQTVLVAGAVTMVIASLGGLRGVLITDLFQFFLALGGAIAAAMVCLDLPEVGGLDALLAHPNVADKLAFLPDFSDPDVWVPVFFIPLAVQWWSSWYPGAEPGGGGYIAQRMLAARSEGHAVGATLFFNVAHYALRPWPWIVVALTSLVVYPDLASIQAAFPDATPGEDLGYPAMLTRLPAGLLGLVLTSLVAAYVSTMSTLLNLGASYVVFDHYQRFVDPEASEEKLVRYGRVVTVVLLVLSSVFALALGSALTGFTILLQVGAGTGAIYLLRWLWWRVNAWTEIVGMTVSFVVALYFQFVHVKVLGLEPMESWRQFVLGVGVTTIAWVLATLVTRPADHATLSAFYRRVRPVGPLWRGFLARAEAAGEPIVPAPGGAFTRGLVATSLGCAMVYAVLFGTGFALYGRPGPAAAAVAVAVLSLIGIRGLAREGLSDAA